MTLNITFSEINQLIYKNGIKLSLSPNFHNSIKAVYSINTLLIKRDVSATIKIYSYHDDVLHIKYDLYGLGMLEKTAKRVIIKKLPSFITNVSDDELKVELNKLPALKKSGYQIRIDSFSISGDVFNVELKLY